MKRTYFGCDACRHFHDPSSSEDEGTCHAFPSGIPLPILFGQHIHTEPYPGDHGILFEAREVEKEEAKA